MLKVILLLLFAATCCQSLTVIEFLRLFYNDYGTISNSSSFYMEFLNEADTHTIIISGEAQHETSDCYKTQQDCCHPRVLNRPRERRMIIPKRPVVSDTTYCTPNGLIGVTTGGTAIYNHFEANCVDVNRFIDGAVDDCNGHFSPTGEYHFHVAPNPECVGNADPTEAHIIGVALDGFAIYDSAFYNGEEQDLDECGGFMPDPNDFYNYRYVAKYSADDKTDHILPCFRAIPLNASCCECRECNREQIPNCTMEPERMGPRFPGTGGGAGPGNGGRFRPGGRPQNFRPGFGGPQNFRPGFGGPQNFRPGFGGPQNVRPGFGGPQNVRPGFGGPQNVRPGFGGPQNVRPGFGGPQNFPPDRPGFCTREQIQQQFQQLPLNFDCSACPQTDDVCVPPGGFADFEEARRMAACRRICRSLTSEQLTLLQRLRNSLG